MSREVAKRALAAFTLCLLALALSGWSNGLNGGDSFGTHDWVLYQANRLATAGGVRWLDWSVAQPATDDPDTVLHDTYHHVYDVWGSPYGDAPTRVQALYDETVRALHSGDREAASRSFGLLSHYYSDICQPMHTDQCPAENAIHSKYELAAQDYTDDPSGNVSWAVADGLVRVPDATAETVRAATSAHGSYSQLVSEFAARGMDAKVLAITRQSVNRAANDLADLLLSAERDSLAGTSMNPRGPIGTATLATQQVTVSATGAAAAVPSTVGTLPQAATSATLPSGSPDDASSGGGAGAIRTPLFWIVVSAAFASALFGALYARRAKGS
jgi:hypothetical protein